MAEGHLSALHQTREWTTAIYQFAVYAQGPLDDHKTWLEMLYQTFDLSQQRTGFITKVQMLLSIHRYALLSPPSGRKVGVSLSRSRSRCVRACVHVRVCVGSCIGHIVVWLRVLAVKASQLHRLVVSLEKHGTLIYSYNYSQLCSYNVYKFE